MRKRQSMADAIALSTQISLIEAKLSNRSLTLADADEIDTIAASVRALEAGKIIVAPTILHRVRALASVARRLRTLSTARSPESVDDR